MRQKDRIAAALQTFFDAHLKEAFASHGSYVVDMWVDLESMRVLVIELNPFHIGAGAALFSWKTDRELFMHGPPDGRGFELRVATELEQDPFSVLPPRWAAYIAARRKASCVTM